MGLLGKRGSSLFFIGFEVCLNVMTVPCILFSFFFLFIEALLLKVTVIYLEEIDDCLPSYSAFYLLWFALQTRDTGRGPTLRLLHGGKK